MSKFPLSLVNTNQAQISADRFIASRKNDIMNSYHISEQATLNTSDANDMDVDYEIEDDSSHFSSSRMYESYLK